jgi:hypothetical protein
MSQIIQNHLVKGGLVLWNTVPAVREVDIRQSHNDMSDGCDGNKPQHVVSDDIAIILASASDPNIAFRLPQCQLSLNFHQS